MTIRKLISKKVQNLVQKPPPVLTPIQAPDGKDRIFAVGETFYAIWDVVKQQGKTGEERFKTVAVLYREPTNKHDSNAVAVWMYGRKVAHLSGDDARSYRDSLDELARRGSALQCPAIVSPWPEKRTAGIELRMLSSDELQTWLLMSPSG